MVTHSLSVLVMMGRLLLAMMVEHLKAGAREAISIASTKLGSKLSGLSSGIPNSTLGDLATQKAEALLHKLGACHDLFRRLLRRVIDENPEGVTGTCLVAFFTAWRCFL
jgi:hypothetical protein